jgi:NAD+ synthase
MAFSKHSIEIDPAAETDRIVAFLQKTIRQDFHRYGGVVGISGGIDSSVVLGLCVRAFGAGRVTAIMMPEKDSEPETEMYARLVAEQFGIEPIMEIITPALDGFACYSRRDEAIRRIFPEYDASAGYKAKIVLPQNLLDEDTLNVFSLIIVTPSGDEKSQRLPLRDYFQIVAASNLKQRTRMSLLYYHAELRNYAVIGTANKNEHDQGFFVKWGDGGADVMPIRHLFKTQVYQLAEYLEVPLAVRQRTPTTDTYSAPTTQQEFFFRLPFETMDLLWYAQEQNVPVGEVSKVMGLTEQQVQRAFTDFSRKSRTTQYLRTFPLDIEMASV